MRTRLALVVDPAAAARQWIAWELQAHFAGVEVAADAAEALVRIEGPLPPDCLVADASASPSRLLDLLGRLHARGGPAPEVLAVAAYLGHQEEIRLLLAGAIGCLRKPLPARELVRVLAGDAGGGEPRPRPAQRLRARLLDPASGHAVLEWEVESLARGEVRLRTASRAPEGQPLRLELRAGAERALVEGCVAAREPAAASAAPVLSVAFRRIAAHDCLAAAGGLEPALSGAPA